MTWLIGLLLLVSCANGVAGEPIVGTSVVSILESGFIVISTTSPAVVAHLCDMKLDQAWGCTHWRPPLKSCLIVIQRGDPQKAEAEILEHELRHCTEGAFHEK